MNVADSEAQGSLLISEFMASNSTILQDEDGDYSDWIEIYNPTGAAVDLDGWYLTDNSGDLTKWRIPAVSIGPSEHLIVFASGKSRSDPSNPLHANFRLDRDGEYLGLVEQDGTT
ncbi:MAG: lamin tail domain-containing protein, partial [Candidatus Omnitrophica bacterium]|nr:lamin tail domain-containing protein [Candidatus Omnitrophota bacterium]